MKRVVRLETSVCFRITRLMNNQTKSRRRATSQKEETATTRMLWLLRKVYHNWVVHHKIQMHSFLKVECLGETLCRKSWNQFKGYDSLKCGRNVDTCDTDANRDLTRNPILNLKPCHVIQPSRSRISLRDRRFFCLLHMMWSFVTRSALVPLKSVAIPETVLTSLLLRHPVCTRSLHSPTVLFTRVPCSVSVEPNSNHVEHVT